MDGSRRGMRLHIAGEWSARDFSDLFAALSALYKMRFVLQLTLDDLRHLEYILERDLIYRPSSVSPRARRLLLSGMPVYPNSGFGVSFLVDPVAFDSARLLVRDHEELIVNRISYASPGSIDLVGIGAVVGHVKDLIFKFVDRADSKRKRELDEEAQSLENEKLRIQNAREFVSLAKECGYSELEIRKLASRVDEIQDPIARLAASTKLQGVSDLEG